MLICSNSLADASFPPLTSLTIWYRALQNAVQTVYNVTCTAVGSVQCYCVTLSGTLNLSHVHAFMAEKFLNF